MSLEKRKKISPTNECKWLERTCEPERGALNGAMRVKVIQRRVIIDNWEHNLHECVECDARHNQHVGRWGGQGGQGSLTSRTTINDICENENVRCEVWTGAQLWLFSSFFSDWEWSVLPPLDWPDWPELPDWEELPPAEPLELLLSPDVEPVEPEPLLLLLPLLELRSAAICTDCKLILLFLYGVQIQIHLILWIN